MTQEQTKKCPFCAEEIKTDAIVCRFCNRDLGSEITKRIVVEKTSKKIKKHIIISTVLLIIGYLLFTSGIFGYLTKSNVDSSTARVGFGFLIGLVGFIWLIVTAIKSWWDRG